MIPITDNESAAQAKYEIERALLSSPDWQLAAGEASLTALEPGGYEFSVEWGKLIFAWWDEGHSQSWHVTAYEISGAELRLRASRGLGRETATFTLRDQSRPRDLQRPPQPTSAELRSRYGALLTSLVLTQVSGAAVRRANTGGNRPRLLPGRYARLVLDLRGETVLAIGANEREGQAEIDGIVAAGIVWLAGFNGRRPDAQQARRLWFCVPQERSQTVVERLTLTELARLGARAECFEVDEAREELKAVRLATQDELLNAHPRELRWPDQPAAHSRWHERILSLAPDLIEVRRHVGQGIESYSIHGLEFARTHGLMWARISFGVINRPSGFNPPAQCRAAQVDRGRRGPVTLTENNFAELERLVREVITYRRAEAPDRRHPFYRLRAEAWLESMLRKNISLLDSSLDERYVYSQIPTWRAEERSVIDLLAVNHQGRLAVIEIKAAEDPNLPLQGLDYWLRVEQARGRGEFVRRGLFPGLRLAAEPPLLYLVAPRLRFHRTFAAIAGCLAPKVETYRIGLNANWRAGVRAHTCERVNGGEFRASSLDGSP